MKFAKSIIKRARYSTLIWLGGLQQTCSSPGCNHTPPSRCSTAQMENKPLTRPGFFHSPQLVFCLKAVHVIFTRFCLSSPFLDTDNRFKHNLNMHRLSPQGEREGPRAHAIPCPLQMDVPRNAPVTSQTARHSPCPSERCSYPETQGETPCHSSYCGGGTDAVSVAFLPP